MENGREQVLRKKEKRRRAEPEAKKQQDQKRVKAVMFVPYTPYSELAKKLREAEEKLESRTGYRLKMVERAGAKLEDLLYTSDPWRGKDCGRELCMLCSSKEKTGKLKKQEKKSDIRNMVHGMPRGKIEEEDGEREEKEELKK